MQEKDFLVETGRRVKTKAFLFANGKFSKFQDSQEKTFFNITEKAIGIKTNATATNTIWYFKNESKFIASTSQRAIIQLLGSFIFNEKVIPWMLLSGSIGPYQSWDRRISMLKPNSRLRYYKYEDKLDIQTKEHIYELHKRTKKQHKEKLKYAITSTFKGLDIPASIWSLSLSGGVDSRGLAALLAKKDSYETVT